MFFTPPCSVDFPRHQLDMDPFTDTQCNYKTLFFSLLLPTFPSCWFGTFQSTHTESGLFYFTAATITDALNRAKSTMSSGTIKKSCQIFPGRQKERNGGGTTIEKKEREERICEIEVFFSCCGLSLVIL